MSLLTTFKAWFPYPVYDFIGGPFDGERRSVPIVEVSDGRAPLAFYQIPDIPKYQYTPDPGILDEEITVHVYKFIPTDSFNEGYYEYVDPDPRGNSQVDDSPVEG